MLIISTSANDFNVNQRANHSIPLSNNNNVIVIDVLMDPTNVEAELETGNNIGKPNGDISVLGLLLQLLRTPRFLFFLFVTLLIAIVKAIAAIYLMLYLSETFNASGTLMGFCVIMGISLEIICLSYSKDIMELFGPRNMMIAGQLSLIIRVGLYGFLGKNMKLWMALPIELLQGITFALIWTAGVEITSSLAPNMLQATYLGIYGGIFQSLSSGIGAITGAAIYSRSPIVMFQAITALAIFALVLYIVGEVIIFQDNKNNRHKYSVLNNNQPGIGQEEER